MTVLFFTSTGNCMQVAKRIGGNLLSIPQMIKANRFHFKDDAIGLITPIYGFGMPKIVKNFLEKATFEAPYIFAVGTYGNASSAAMYNLSKHALKHGISMSYVNDLLMVDNYLPLFDPEKQIAMLPQKKTEENLQKIVADIQNRTVNEPVASVLNRVMSSAIQGINKFFLSHNYTVNQQCTACGACAKVCPTGNIVVAQKPVFGNRCENCLGCVHHCPSNAIHLKNEKTTARYRNNAVSLREIQEANSQI